MKKFFSLLTLCMIFTAISLCTFSAQAATCDTYDGSNVGYQDYNRWSKPVTSYLSPCANGKLMRFQASDGIDGYLVEYYDNNFDFERKKIIKKELPLFGAFYETDSFYFILSGQENRSESASAEVFRVTKYDKNWNRISSVSLKDCNTTIPFDAGSARMAVSGKSLIIRTSHEMYRTSDGYNHQANVTIVVDIATMKITDSRTIVWNTENGYVSHSFNQFVKTSGNLTAFVDHGDAYPRSVVLFTQKGSGSLKCFDLLSIPGSVGDNTTGVTVGGFEISSTSYLVAMSNVNLNDSFRTNKTRNIYIASADIKSDGTIDRTNVKINRLTFNPEGGATASTPQLVKISDNEFIVLWECGGNVCYCRLDGQGKKTGDIIEMKGSLSDCAPVVYNGKIVWYTWNGKYTSFYEISLSDISKNNSKLAENGHKYVNNAVTNNTASLVCSVCGDKTTMKVATDFDVFWKNGENVSGIYSTVFPSDLSDADALNFDIRINEKVDNDEFDISVSDPSVVLAPMYGKTGTVKIIGHGESSVTFKLKYNPGVSKTFKINTHKMTKKSAVSATCTESGLTEGIVCSSCGFASKEQETVPAKGHDFSKKYIIDKQPTCTESGVKSLHCSRCTATKDFVSIAPTGHKFGAWANITSPSCTVKGLQTRRCSVCGDVENQNTNALGHSYSKEWTVDVAATCIKLGSKSHHCVRCDSKIDITRIEYTGHEYGNWTLFKAATCTNDGVEKRTCKNCSDVETRAIMKLGHKETTDNALEPTCLLGGKTKGSHCITCGYVINKQENIPPLGHDVVIDLPVEPTCTAVGKGRGSHCARCRLVLEKQEIIKAKGHVIVNDERVEATCENSGKTEGKHCEVCSLVTEKPAIIPALGHKLIDTLIKKTCTADGYTTHECTVCGYSYRDNFDYAKGHTEVTVRQIQETCTTDGFSVKTYCPECGLIFSEGQVIPATGHQPKIVTVPATTKKNGSKTVKCSVCGVKISSSVIAKIETVKLSATSYVYDGKAKKPAVVVKNVNGKSLKSGTDYKVTYDSGRKKSGTYYVTVTFKGDYSGKKSLKFKIVLGQTKNLKVTAKNKNAVLKWSKTKGASKYEIYYSTSKTGKFKKLTTVKSNSATAKKLKSGKAYYFKVRAVTTDAGGNKTRGAFSSLKKVKISL